jgi:hypothetical protein
MKTIKKLAILGTVTAVSTAMANTITPTLLGFVPGVEITYGANHTSGEMQAGDGFTIYDVGGFAGVISAIPPGWISSVSATGSIYDGDNSIPGSVLINAPDDPSLPNVTFTWTGATVQTTFGTTPVGTFVLATTGNELTTDTWASRDHELNIGGVGGVATEHADNILVPTFVNRVPDGGATAMLLGAGVIGLGLVRRKA